MHISALNRHRNSLSATESALEFGGTAQGRVVPVRALLLRSIIVLEDGENFVSGSREGKLVRHFANGQNKISCDPEMQLEIDTYLSEGDASFSISMLVNSIENWESATLKLMWSGFQVKINKTECAQIVEKFSEDLSIKIPYGISTQFDTTISDGCSYSFSMDTDKARFNSLDHEKVPEQVTGKCGKKTIIGIHNQPFMGHKANWVGEKRGQDRDVPVYWQFIEERDELVIPVLNTANMSF
ncbi:hypothetical protein AKJ16_DCAP10393 [Drosera capensis]